ncbi:MAG: hypothetical protein MR967_01385 [Holdemanella sp.]|uniref:hypothetical protein n=1 Tax=Holdemanella sp. TaxID=1971762 RepID=UPI002587C99A|nr:hypothetical protein [Holdemanella sp.]MCI7165585.1 hypothetical protein [Holdemanella sp.]
MWVRSQNKEVLVNVNDVCFFKIKKDSYQFRCYGYGDDYYILGEYSTEEKALTVLDMIEKVSMYSGNTLFQMPKDDEVEV